MKSVQEEAIEEVIYMAMGLGWIRPPANGSAYPLMQLSEVEKCMMALIDGDYLNRMKLWYVEAISKKESNGK